MTADSTYEKLLQLLVDADVKQASKVLDPQTAKKAVTDDQLGALSRQRHLDALWQEVKRLETLVAAYKAQFIAANEGQNHIREDALEAIVDARISERAALVKFLQAYLHTTGSDEHRRFLTGLIQVIEQRRDVDG